MSMTQSSTSRTVVSKPSSAQSQVIQESPASHKDIAVDSIQKMKTEFMKKFVEQTLIQNIGINAYVEIVQDYDYEEYGRSKTVDVAVIISYQSLSRNYIMNIEKYFGIRDLWSGMNENGVPYLNFIVNLPEGIAEAYKAYLESI